MKVKRFLIWSSVGVLIGLLLNAGKIDPDNLGGVSYYALGFSGIYVMVAVSLAAFINVEYDMIHEDGIRKKSASLTELFIGKVFIPYRRIAKIGYGTSSFPVPYFPDIMSFPTRDLESDFIVLYLKGSDDLYSFLKIEYRKSKKVDFYLALGEILQKKCPNVPWIEMEWADWRYKPRAKTREVRNGHPGYAGYSCSYCGGALSFIPEYGRWYCYDCQEYAPED